MPRFAPFCNLFHYLSKFSNNDFFIKKELKKGKNKMKKTKQIVIERQIIKTLNITHCTLQTSKVGYPYNVVMVLAYLSFASSAILLRRGN